MKLSHAIGFDDAPFDRANKGNVPIFGTVYARHSLHAVVSSKVRKDGQNSTDVLLKLIETQAEHLQIILLQGIALAGFNVIDIQRLSHSSQLPVLVVARKPPNLEKVKAALEQVSGGQKKWQLIEAAGPMEPCEDVQVQRVGLSPEQASEVLKLFCNNGKIPEPLRVAHLIAGGVTRGNSAGQRA